MYPTQKRMSQGLAVFAAILALLMAVFTIIWISDYAEDYLDYGGDAATIHVVYQYVLVAMFALIAAMFFRQQADKTLSATLKLFIALRILLGIVQLIISMTDGYYSTRATMMIGEVLPYILMVLCCSEKDGGKSVKATTLILGLILACTAVDFAFSHIKVPADEWLDFDYMKEEVFPIFARLIFYYVAAKAVGSGVGKKEDKEPVIERPTYQQPTYQQPTYQQPTYQQPTYQQPAYQQPTYQQPTYQQPTYQQPTYQQPTYQQPTYQQPTYQQPVYQQPAQPAERPAQPTAEQ